MTELILFMVMDEKSTRVQIFHSITDIFSAAGTTDDDIKVQEIGFHGDFMWDQMPKMVQVTENSFKNIKVKTPSLITIRQEIDLGILTDHTLLPHDVYLGKETVPILLPFPWTWIEI